jgi:hypothetical protein
LDRNVVLAIVVTVAAALAWVWISPIGALAFRASDDAFYYFQVARNWTAGAGPTFDGIHPTNGFHPLWMLLLLPIYAGLGADPEIALRAVYTLIVLVGGATAWVAYRAFSWHVGRAAAAVTLLLLASPPFLNPLVNGLETGLLLLVSFLFLDLAARRDLLRTGVGAAADALLGALLGLLFLARLDSAFLVLAAFVAVVVRWAGEGATRRPLGALMLKLLRTGAVAASYAVPYVLWNVTQFGHTMPISGALKSAFPEWSFSWAHLMEYHGRYGLGQIAAMSAVLVAFAVWRRRARREDGGPPRISAAFLVLVAGSAIHFANTLAYMVWGVHWWHFAGYAPAALTAIAIGLALIAQRWPRVVVATAILFLMFVAAAHVADLRRRGVQHERWLEAALWSRANLPPDAAVGMTDCGLFGYFSGRRTVNLDGVINGYRYQEALRDHRLTEFLDLAGVTHVATHAARYRDGEFLIWLPSRMYRTDGGAIVGYEGREAFRSAPYEGVVFAIWRRDGVRVLDDVNDLRRTATNEDDSGEGAR